MCNYGGTFAFAGHHLLGAHRETLIKAEFECEQNEVDLVFLYEFIASSVTTSRSLLSIAGLLLL